MAPSRYAKNLSEILVEEGRIPSTLKWAAC